MYLVDCRQVEKRETSQQKRKKLKRKEKNTCLDLKAETEMRLRFVNIEYIIHLYIFYAVILQQKQHNRVIL